MDRPRLFGLCREHYAVAADLRCSKCGETKPVGAFQNPSSDGTRHSWCISCRDASWKERYAANPALFRERSRWATVKNRYGITQEQYEEMLAAQNGVCAVCYQPERHKTRKRLSVDHDHATGRVRGLLCAGCNAAIGNFDEDPARMLAAVRYLEG